MRLQAVFELSTIVLFIPRVIQKLAKEHFVSEWVLFTLGTVHRQAIVRLKPIVATNNTV